jgi:hypothetical protein
MYGVTTFTEPSFLLLLVAAAMAEAALVTALIAFRKLRRDRAEDALRSRVQPVIALIDQGDSASLAEAIRTDPRATLDIHQVLAEAKSRQADRLRKLADHPGAAGLEEQLTVVELNARLCEDFALASAAQELFRALPTTTKAA